MEIDWKRPLELLDGTPVVLETDRSHPDRDGDYWIVREDGEEINSVEVSRWGEFFHYRQMCVHRDGREEATDTVIVRNRGSEAQQRIRDAAPELLEALQSLVGAIAWDHANKQVEAAKAAIARALGTGEVG